MRVYTGIFNLEIKQKTPAWFPLRINHKRLYICQNSEKKILQNSFIHWSRPRPCWTIGAFRRAEYCSARPALTLLTLGSRCGWGWGPTTSSWVCFMFDSEGEFVITWGQTLRQASEASFLQRADILRSMGSSEWARNSIILWAPWLLIAYAVQHVVQVISNTTRVPFGCCSEFGCPAIAHSFSGGGTVVSLTL